MIIKIEKASVFKQDERGIAYDFSTRPSSYFVVLHRKAGTVSGSHYHKGTIQSKAPEILYLVSGKATVLVKDIVTGLKEEYEIEYATKIEIPPNIYHEIKAKTDIILIEFNVDKKDFQGYKADTVKIETL